MSISKAIVNAAISLRANVGREYDSAGKHVAYYLIVTPEWKIYRHSVSGMLALLRQVRKDRQSS